MIKKILVAIDDSEASEKALKFAINLAKAISAEILLISVVPYRVLPMFSLPSAPSPTINPRVTATFLEASRIGHKKVISKSLKKINKTNSDLKVSAKLTEGNPANRIIEAAQDENIDLIIVGNKNRSGIHKFFLGSVSNSVVNDSNIPVLVVK